MINYAMVGIAMPNYKFSKNSKQILELSDYDLLKSTNQFSVGNIKIWI